MLQFYHDLGVIVYYGGLGTLDNTLRNTVILKPQWLVDMFKRIITVRDLEQQVQSSLCVIVEDVLVLCQLLAQLSGIWVCAVLKSLDVYVSLYLWLCCGSKWNMS